MDSTRIRIDDSTTRRIRARDAAPTSAPSPAAAAKPKRRRWTRLLRWVIGLAVLAEAGWLVIPMALYRTSVRATITAPLVAVRVSHEGEVVGNPPHVGTMVKAGQPLFELQMAIPDRRPADRLRGEIESTRRAVASLTEQIAKMDVVKQSLVQHFHDYREARTAQAERQSAEQSARVKAAEARLSTAEFEVSVQRRLSGKGAASGIELARAENALVEVRNELDVARQGEARHKIQLEAARKGYFVGEADGGQDRVASRQRCDEIELQQAGLRERIGELDGQIQAMESRLASEERHLAATRIPVVAPIDGVVWSSPLVAGSEVSPGANALEIIDASQLRAEALFRGADAERIRPGWPVKVRMLGSSQVLDGHVVRVADPATIELEGAGGSDRHSAYTGTFRAVIKLDEQPSADGRSASQDFVGGSAIVWSPR